jgi:hypothetical protein
LLTDRRDAGWDRQATGSEGPIRRVGPFGRKPSVSASTGPSCLDPTGDGRQGRWGALLNAGGSAAVVKQGSRLADVPCTRVEDETGKSPAGHLEWASGPAGFWAGGTCLSTGARFPRGTPGERTDESPPPTMVAKASAEQIRRTAEAPTASARRRRRRRRASSNRDSISHSNVRAVATSDSVIPPLAISVSWDYYD